MSHINGMFGSERDYREARAQIRDELSAIEEASQAAFEKWETLRDAFKARTKALEEYRSALNEAHEIGIFLGENNLLNEGKPTEAGQLVVDCLRLKKKEQRMDEYYGDTA